MNSTVTTSQAIRVLQEASQPPLQLAHVLLVRIAAGGGRESQIAKDLHALAPLQPSGEAWNAQISRLIAALFAAAQVERAGDQLAATKAGQAAAAAFLGCRKPLDQGWPVVRDGLLVARALGLAGAPAARLKALAKVDGLSAQIVESHWKLKLKGRPSASRIRSSLALVALERAFGNQIKSELGAKSALSAKASRLLAGQLARKPRDFRTDTRLVAALAMEAVGARRSDLVQLRLGVLGQFLGLAVPPAVRAPAGVAAPAPVPESPAAVAAPMPQPLPPAQRPDPAGFARAVKLAAAASAEGWPGNRRAYVAAVWGLIRERHPEWGVTDIEFKAMLVEAHRLGLVALVNADLKDKRQLEIVEASAITYKNTVWHYVRVED